ncbi:nitrilase [Kangiella profundi]|nr:nitrilase [Kangiella profundi]
MEMNKQLVVGLVQMTSSSRIEDNLERAEAIIEQLVEQGAEVIVLPESFALMEKYNGQKLEHLEQHGNGLIQSWMSSIARKQKVLLVGGTIAIQSDIESRPYARCYIYDEQGIELTHYDKIHMFDVSVKEGESYSESANTLAGERPVVFEWNNIKFGCSVCYDLRFPELYRYYQTHNVDVILAPSAFTLATGKVHWKLLLQARAVENLAFVVAPNQTGTHDNQRKTYGHSMTVDPWGAIVGELAEQQGGLLCNLDLSKIETIKEKFPVHQHRKLMS